MELKSLFDQFVRWELVKGYSPLTVVSQRRQLVTFFYYLEERGISQLEKITSELLNDFQEYWAFKTTKEGRFLTPGTRNNLLATLKMFFRWLRSENYLATDLNEKIIYAKVPQQLPRNILTLEEIKKVLENPDMTVCFGYRDRVLMELFYGTGIRLKEIRGIKIGDIDLAGQSLYIREGKGNKERVVPLSPGLCQLITHYLTFLRPVFLRDKVHDYLFCGRKGPLALGYISNKVRRYGRKVLGSKKLSPHMFRHACATHMLANGADIRHVQELLGHVRITTTQIYTHVTINELKKAHKRYHPRERMKLKNDPPQEE